MRTGDIFLVEYLKLEQFMWAEHTPERWTLKTKYWMLGKKPKIYQMLDSLLPARYFGVQVLGALHLITGYTLKLNMWFLWKIVFNYSLKSLRIHLIENKHLHIFMSILVSEFHLTLPGQHHWDMRFFWETWGNCITPYYSH